MPFYVLLTRFFTPFSPYFPSFLPVLYAFFTLFSPVFYAFSALLRAIFLRYFSFFIRLGGYFLHRFLYFYLLTRVIFLLFFYDIECNFCRNSGINLYVHIETPQ
jgi:hypothetical protein